MAVIDKNSKKNAASQDATESTDNSKGRVVDILSDKTLPRGVKSKLDKEEDAWAFSAPPEAGRYPLKLFLAKEAVTLKYRNEDSPSEDEIYYVIAMECKIADDVPDHQGVRVFPRVTTVLGRGKSISTAAGLLVKLGYKIPDEADDFTIAKLVVQAIQKEPVVDVELDWQGWSRDDKRVAYKGMLSFPVDGDGQRQHIVRYRNKSGQEEEITASVQVVHWYGKKEGDINRKGAAGAGAGVGKAGSNPQPVLLSNEEETTATVAIPAAASKESNEDSDLELLLQD